MRTSAVGVVTSSTMTKSGAPTVIGASPMTDEQIQYEWQRSLTPDEETGKWIVIDWQGHRYAFDTEDDQLAFIARDKRLLAAASAQAMNDVTRQISESAEVEYEQAVDEDGEAEEGGTGLGRQGNRESRRRARRATHSKKASGRGRKAT